MLGGWYGIQEGALNNAFNNGSAYVFTTSDGSYAQVERNVASQCRFPRSNDAVGEVRADEVEVLDWGKRCLHLRSQVGWGREL